MSLFRDPDGHSKLSILSSFEFFHLDVNPRFDWNITSAKDNGELLGLE
jgi:hypothetical protein